MSFQCVCPEAGECPLHNVYKTQREVAICNGTSGLDEQHRQEYLVGWGEPAGVLIASTATTEPRRSAPRIQPRSNVTAQNTEAFACIHRTEKLSSEAITEFAAKNRLQIAEGLPLCNMCGNRGRPFDVFGCTIHGVCTIGMRARGVKSCVGCSDKQADAVDNQLPRRIGGLSRRRSGRPIPSPTDPPIVSPSRFTREPTRHLIYHIWPKRHSEIWKWNVAELRKRIEMFDGLRIIGIALSDDTATLDEVQAEFDGVRIDEWIDVPNDKVIGEGATFFEMMELLPHDENSITFYGHAKGTKYTPDKLGVILRWTDLMYRACLDNFSAVRESLESFPITGSMKRYGDFNKPDTWRWHYSGTFFWFRNGDVFRNPKWRRLVKFYGAIECWPSCLFKAAEAGYVFGDNVGGLYLEEEIIRLETQFATWPDDMRLANNGVNNRWFFQEEYRRQIDSGNWPNLLATHTSGATVLKSLGAVTVSEIGSGLGAFLLGAKSIGLNATGFGCSRFERDFAITRGVSPEKYSISVIQDFKMTPVDAVYCTEVFEHVHDHELAAILPQIAASCRWFYFTSIPDSAPDDQQWGHINLKSKQQWVEFFATFGLRYVRDDLAVTPWGMLFATT